jgi:hypothetical protein
MITDYIREAMASALYEHIVEGPTRRMVYRTDLSRLSTRIAIDTGRLAAVGSAPRTFPADRRQHSRVGKATHVKLHKTP